jgi:tetraacyldisaccharide-1-P 4'-kinase
VAFRRAFRDHHRYSPDELKQLAREAAADGAETLVTTGKDAMNLPHGAAEFAAPLKLLWLEIGIEIENEEEFLRSIL